MINRILNLNHLLKQKNQSSFLFGARGTGKTNLCLEFLKKQPYFSVNLLLNNLFKRYLSKPEQFRKDVIARLSDEKHLTVFVDEIQKVPALLDEVHALIEEFPQKLRFLLTGSSARKLKRSGANLLAGRAWELRLHPFTHLEVSLNLERALQFGTLPKIYLTKGRPIRSLNSYVTTYLKEEIQQEALVRKVDSFVRFLEVAAQMHGEPINFSSIARSANVTDKTAEEYFSILVDTLIAFRIDGWAKSIKKQLLQSPRYYFFDCGVLNALRNELHTELNSSSFRYGRLFETFVILELIRLNDYYECSFKFNYWRTNSGLEVDIILSRGNYEKPVAIEIKSSENPIESEMNALHSFSEDNKGARLYCLCQTPHAYKLGEIQVLPWQLGIKKIFGIK